MQTSVSTPPRESMHRRCCRGESALSRSVMIQVRGTSAGRSLRSTHSVITRADSGYRRDSANLRCSRDMPFQNANLAAALGIAANRLIRAPTRARGASGPPRVSTTDDPCGGMNAVARIISRTRVPSLATTPGTVSPPNECPTTTTSPSKPSSTSVTTESTQSATVTLDKSAGLRPRPGRSTAITRNFGSWHANSATVRSQQSAACAPP